MSMRKVVIMTREYPPHVYGGAGVHVDYLSRELSRLIEVEVRCFGPREPEDERAGGSLRIRAYTPAPGLSGVLGAVSVDVQMAAGIEGATIVHSHTWYANLAGHLAKLGLGIPHVVTTHSLEPLRPWKAEQLGAGGYELSRFCEQTGIESADAVIAVSEEMRRDVMAVYPGVEPERVHVIHNGIEPDEYRPDPETDVLETYGVDPSGPLVVFVGRITRQKGIAHLLEAAAQFEPSAQLALCAGAPDTPEIGREIESRVAELSARRDGVIWIDRMLEKREVIQLLSHASVFVCPSVYEPLGIVNLEAMACGAPVVATATGGIPEVVEDGVTGLLVPFDVDDRVLRTPTDPERFAADMAGRVNALLRDPARARAMGEAGRRRAVERFSWRTIAERTLELYRSLASA